MKNLFFKIVLIAASALSFGLLTGCNPEQPMKPFTVEFTGHGPGYVTCMVTVPYPTTVSYVISEEPLPYIDASSLNMMGVETTFYTDGEQQLLDFPIEENKHYYVYLVGILGDDFSKMYEYEFETGEFTFDQLATVVAVAPDGYKVHIKVPESVRTSVHGQPGSRAIRYTQGDLMIYNFYKSSNDDYFNLLYNAGKYVTEDTFIEYSDKLNFGEAGIDVNEDGVIDGEDLAMQWNPIAPGEPVVFVAGEFEWMEEPDEYKKGGALEDKAYKKDGFAFPGGWDAGYYYPCLNAVDYWAYYGKSLDDNEDDDDDSSTEGSDDAEGEGTAPATRGTSIITDIDLTSGTDPFWTGAFQRKVFRTRMPAKLDARIQVSVEDLMSVNATVRITPDEKVYRYLFTVMDDASYNQLLDLLDGKTEYLQWATTSYFSMYNFGQTQVVAETGMTSAPSVTFDLNEYFYDVPSETKYHVLVTGMSGDIGSPQCFTHYIFSTPAKIKTKGPTVVVTAYPEEECDPYTARFNVRCTSTADNPVDRCYYGANYLTEWVYSVNKGSSYETLGQTVEFTAAEIAQINSPKGLEMKIPTIDHETTRLVVVAFNDENVSNGVNKAEDPLAHPAIDDCTTPYAEAKNTSYNPLLHDRILTGEWILSAKVKGGATKTQRINIRDGFYEGVDYPSTLPDEVLAVYQNTTKWTEDEIYGYFDEFKGLASEYNEGRLKGQNKLLIEGWLDDSKGSLAYLSPWDLFKHEKISVVDVPSMFARFGPKIYLHVNKDMNGKDSLSVTANKMFVSPVADWSIPFYMAGRTTDNSTVFQYSDAKGNYLGALEFPVTLSEDNKTITIHPLEADNQIWYPNVIGVYTQNYVTDYVLEEPIESEVVLTKVTDETPDETPEVDEPAAPATRSSAVRNNVKTLGNPQFTRYFGMSDFRSIEAPKKIKVEVMTLDKVHANMERFREEHLKRMR